MKDFKVGDPIKIVANEPGDPPIGSIHKITEVGEDYVYINWDNDDRHSMRYREVTLVSPETRPMRKTYKQLTNGISVRNTD